MFERFSIREIKLERIKNHIARRSVYLSLLPKWYVSDIGRRNVDNLSEIKDKHNGQTCVVICNGPSLNRTDMSLVADQYSFCMNRSYLLFDQWGFTPTYFSITNQLVLRQFLDDIRALPMPKFTDFAYRKLLRLKDDTYYFRLPPRLTDSFGGDLHAPITSGGTVTFATLQVAFYMGFSKVIIIGMDHRFSAKGTPSTSEIRKDTVDHDHAHPQYFPKGIKWELPDLVRSEIAYGLARDAYERAGKRLIDATVDGACTVFEKMPLKEALRA